MKKRQFMKELKQTIAFLQQVSDKAEKEPASRINDYEIYVKALVPDNNFWCFSSKIG